MLIFIMFVVGFFGGVLTYLLWRNWLPITVFVVVALLWNDHVPDWVNGLLRAPFVVALAPLDVLKYTGPFRWFFYVAYPASLLVGVGVLVGKLVERYVRPCGDVRPEGTAAVLDADSDSIWF